MTLPNLSHSPPSYQPPELSTYSPFLNYHQTPDGLQSLHIEGTALSDLVDNYSTPLFIYSENHLHQQYQRYVDGLKSHKHLICFAVKSCSNIQILRSLAKLGAGFDIVSVGELIRVLEAGGEVQKVVFSGVGKSAEEIDFALQKNIGCFNVESESELQLLEKIASKQNKVAPISLRVNPNINPKTHPYISTGLHDNKFGISIDKVVNLYQQIQTSPHLEGKGISCHIGSQLLDLSPLIEAMDSLLAIVQQLQKLGIELQHIDLGGGIGINYTTNDSEQQTQWEEYFNALLQNVPQHLEIHLEPGRSIVGNAGILITQILHIKNHESNTFVVIDAAMNDLIRPALYQSWHEIIPVAYTADQPLEQQTLQIVGPVCETADFLGNNRHIPVQQNDYLAILSAGAYSAVMGSNYNSRLKPAEVLVNGDQHHLIRQRETYQQLLENEKSIPKIS